MKIGEFHQDRKNIYFVNKVNGNNAEVLLLNGKIVNKEIKKAEWIDRQISLAINNSLHLIFSSIDEASEYLDLKKVSYNMSNPFKVLYKATKHFISDNPEYNIAEYLYTINNYCFGFKIPLIKFSNIKWIRLFLWAEHNKWEFPITLSSNNHEIWYSRISGYHHKDIREYIDLNDFEVLKQIHHFVLMYNYIGKRFQFDKYHCRLNDSKNKYICFIQIQIPIDEDEREKNRQEALMWIEKYKERNK